MTPEHDPLAKPATPATPAAPTPDMQPTTARQAAAAPAAGPSIVSAPVPEKKKKSKTAVISVCIVVILLLTVFMSFVPTLLDLIRGAGYEPAPKMAQIMEDIHLTGKGARIFNATQPELQDREEFATSGCNDTYFELSTLGCYDGQFIYVFDSQNEELDGLEESTAAHELLHAVWDRMLPFERDKLEPYIRSFYEENLDHLGEYMKNYPEEKFVNELHSVIGTEFPADKIPEPLRKHYETVFEDFDSLYSEYDKYTKALEEHHQELRNLLSYIDEHTQELKAKEEEYALMVAQYNQDVENFNNRASRPGGFHSQAEFDSARRSLVNRSEIIQRSYESNRKEVDDINQRIAEYNKLVLHQNELIQSLNSRTDSSIEKVK